MKKATISYCKDCKRYRTRNCSIRIEEGKDPGEHDWCNAFRAKPVSKPSLGDYRK